MLTQQQNDLSKANLLTWREFFFESTYLPLYATFAGITTCWKCDCFEFVPGLAQNNKVK